MEKERQAQEGKQKEKEVGDRQANRLMENKCHGHTERERKKASR